jgi:ABC-type branched-subunit amino acid transport system substrate-binding protein
MRRTRLSLLRTRHAVAAAWAIGVFATLPALSARAEPPTAKIAVHTSLSGSGAFGGQALLETIQFAIDEANATGGTPRFLLVPYDDRSSNEGAVEVAQQISAGDALVVLGPAVSPLALIACPIYGKAGIATIDSTVHADAVTESATTFRIVVSTGEIGEAARSARRRRTISAACSVPSSSTSFTWTTATVNRWCSVSGPSLNGSASRPCTIRSATRRTATPPVARLRLPPRAPISRSSSA